MIGTNNKKNRDEWLEAILSSIPLGKSILDAGAGELANKKYCKHLEYTSQDFCEYDGAGDARGLQTNVWDTRSVDIVSDICNIPCNDKSFDVILCSEVIEHLPNPIDALSEFYRLLKSGGILILTAPFCSLTHFAPYHYSTGFNRYFYEYHLDKIGFKLEHISTNGNYFEYLAQEIHRIPTMTNIYSSITLNRFEKYFLRKVINILEKIAYKDVGSEELLCYGYHVIAKK